MKTKKIITCILVGICIFPFHLNAQTPTPQEYMPSIVPVSPNAASLGVFGSIPVGHYTGVPNINIPLYEIDLDGKTIPISLSYHASGIKVAQEASWVGLGWTLNAGGCITRDMRGWDDFASTGGSEPKTGYYWNASNTPNNNNSAGVSGHTYVFFEAQGIPYFAEDSYTYNTRKINCSVGQEILKGTADVNPDLFYYNFANHTGSMFVNRSQYPSREPKASFRKVEEYLDATVNLKSSTTPWFIVDGEGYRYYFGGSVRRFHLHRRDRTARRPGNSARCGPLLYCRSGRGLSRS